MKTDAETILANNYPERAREIFPGVTEGKEINFMFSEPDRDFDESSSSDY